jgi:hypothetical protein
MTHYAQVTDADMKEAAKISVIEDAKKKVPEKGPAHTNLGCNGLHDENQGSDITPYNFSNLQPPAPSCTNVQKGKNGPGWIRTSVSSR